MKSPCLFVCLLATLRKRYELIFMKSQWVYGTMGFERVLLIITWIQRADIKCNCTRIGNLIMEKRRSYNGRISTMEFSILVRWYLYTELGSRVFFNHIMYVTVRGCWVFLLVPLRKYVQKDLLNFQDKAEMIKEQLFCFTFWYTVSCSQTRHSGGLPSFIASYSCIMLGIFRHCISPTLMKHIRFPDAFERKEVNWH